MRRISFLVLILISVCGVLRLSASDRLGKRGLFYKNSPDWVQTGGPPGGRMEDVEIAPSNPSILYATGPSRGIYRSSDGGDSWELRLFTEQQGDPIFDLLVDPRDEDVIYGSYDFFSKSTDGGLTWDCLRSSFEEIHPPHVYSLDPVNPDIVYIAGRLWDDSGIALFRGGNGGASWTNITGNLQTNAGCEPTSFIAAGDGSLLISLNDRPLQTWHTGKVFRSTNGGASWQEVDYGQFEDRFVSRLMVNPADLDEVWLSESSMYNAPLQGPVLYKSPDGGASWTPVHVNCTNECGIGGLNWIVGGSNDGRMYVSTGDRVLMTADGGLSFTNITTSFDIVSDVHHVAVHPMNSDVLYIPISVGVLGSEDGGTTWTTRNEGILNTRINMVTADPSDPAIVYAASNSGEGTFRSDDYGQNWHRLNEGGLHAAFIDEIVVDPVDPRQVWAVGEVPNINRSMDRGETWEHLFDPGEGGTFNFGSIYAVAPTSDLNTLYACNNGFGIFKTENVGEDWSFLHQSEVDYTYTLAVHPTNPDVVYSGYSRKPFQDFAMIRKSSDGGESWTTALHIDGAEAVTSVVVDPQDPDRVFAASTGEAGGRVWRSSDTGGSWQKPNDYFDFATIHSFAVVSDASPVAFAGVWGGGTYKTGDFGQIWEKLPGDEVFSAAAIVVDPDNPDIVYAADRTMPVLYRSVDGGATWAEFYRASPEYRRLMCVTIDPSDGDRLYVAAMKRGGPGRLGGLFKIEDGVASDINGILPKVPLSVTVDPSNPLKLYTVLHESGVYKSTNGGSDWVEISDTASGLPESGFSNLIIHPVDNSRLYLIGGCDVRFDTFESAGLDDDAVNGVYRSMDGGATWVNINGGVLGAASGAVKSLCFHGEDSDVMYAGCENGVYVTTDGGASWQFSAGLPYTTLGGIALSGSTIYAFTNGAGLFTGSIQPDDSVVWDTDQKIVAEIFFAQVLKDPQNGSVLYASGYPGGIFKSTDDGATWHEANFGMVSFQVDDPLRQGYYALDISPSDPDVLYLGLYERGVYRSSNAGATWYPANGASWEMATKAITSVAMDPNDPEIVYVGAEDGVQHSVNGGQSWATMNTGLPSTDIRVLEFGPSGDLFAGTRGYGLFRWHNGSWRPLRALSNFGVFWPIWDNRPLYQYTSHLIHPQDNSRMLLGTFPQGIYASDDGGYSWRESNVGWTTDGVFCLVTHPDNPEIVYSGTYNGVNRSPDWGAHWEMWDAGWPDEQWVFCIDFDPTNPEIMYACSKNGEDEGRGRDGFRGTVMKSLDGGATWFAITDGLGLGQEFYKIIVDRFDPETVYLATQERGVFISEDGGASWSEWNEGLTNRRPGTNGNNVTNSMVLSADHSILYFGSAGSGVFRRMIAPVLPVNRLYADVEDHRAILHWEFDDLNGNFSHYQVYRETTDFETVEGLTVYATVADVVQTMFTDETVVPGTPYYYAVTTVSTDGYENDHAYVLGPVVDSGMSVDMTTMKEGEVGIAYTDTLEASGGLPPYTWEIVEGVLPPGLSLMDTTGVITGTPKTSGTFDFTVRVSDSGVDPLQASERVQIVVHAATRVEDDAVLPLKTCLHQNYPNPFNAFTTIEYDLHVAGPMAIRVYDMSGRVVRTLVEEDRDAGRYSAIWDGGDETGGGVASGLYMVVMEAGLFRAKQKVLLLK